MITTYLEEKVSQALKKLDIPTDEIKVNISNRKDLCDYQFDGSFKIAKELHKSPIEISTLITKELKNENKDDFSKIEALNGFVNLTLSSKIINKMLNEMIINHKFNIKPIQNDTYVIDYGGPNIAKPLHVGHLRSAIVGESIKRIIKYLGGNIISDVHLGDYGLQIGQVIYGLKEKNIKIEDINIKILEDIYPKISGLCKENEDIKQKCEEITKQLQEGNKEYQEYFQKIKEESIKDIKRIYNYLGVSFDKWYGESDAYKYIAKTTEYLNEKNLLKMSEGAKIVEVNETSDQKEIPPFIYQKSNGGYLYSTTDLATIIQRIKDFNPKYILYVTDNRQGLYFNQVFRVAKKLDISKNINYEHLPFGTVNDKDGKPFKTRSGHVPKLDELFKEVKEVFLESNPKNKEMSQKDIDILVNSIIKFADLQNNREKDYNFDIQKFSMVTGKTGPYILYTYLRINSILKEEKINNKVLNEEIYNESDRSLRLKLLELELNLNNSFLSRMPSVLANFLYDLCVLINSFYETNHIKGIDNVNKKENWLILLQLSANILKNMLDLLGIQIPEKM